MPPEELLKDFAKRERLKIRLDECGDPVIRGRYGSIYEQDERLAVCLEFNPDTRKRLRPTAHRKLKLIAHCRRNGPEVLIEGADECIILAKPGHVDFLKEAIHVLKVKRRRRVSEETANRLRALARKRQAGTLEGHF